MTITQAQEAEPSCGGGWRAEQDHTTEVTATTLKLRVPEDHWVVLHLGTREAAGPHHVVA